MLLLRYPVDRFRVDFLSRDLIISLICFCISVFFFLSLVSPFTPSPSSHPVPHVAQPLATARGCKSVCRECDWQMLLSVWFQIHSNHFLIVVFPAFLSCTTTFNDRNCIFLPSYLPSLSNCVFIHLILLSLPCLVFCCPCFTMFLLLILGNNERMGKRSIARFCTHISLTSFKKKRESHPEGK